MRRVRVRIDEADRYRLHAVAAQDRRHSAHVLLVERCHDLTGVVDPLGHLEAIAAADVGRRDVLVRVPQILLRAAADLDDVPEAPRRHHRRARKAPRDQRVRRDGRAVGEQSNVPQVDTRLDDPCDHGVDRVYGRRHLSDLDLAASSSRMQMSVNVPPTSTATRMFVVLIFPALSRRREIGRLQMNPASRLRTKIGICIKMPI